MDQVEQQRVFSSTVTFSLIGKLTFEEFAEIYLMLNHYAGTTPNGRTRTEKFNYILDQYDQTPGDEQLKHALIIVVLCRLSSLAQDSSHVNEANKSSLD